jgi:dihydroorotate dehydrogenase electron transfer subunit
MCKHSARGETVFREAAPVIDITALPGAHCRLRLRAPAVAAAVRPGQFVNVRPPLDAALLRRPLGVYRTFDETDLELLFKVVGRGTRALADVTPGQEIDLIGPLGNGFDLSGEPPRTAVLVAGGFGIAPLHPLALALRDRAERIFLFVGTEEDLPLEMSDSSLHASFVDPDVSATLTDFETLGVVGRVASLRPRPGFFRGLVTDLLDRFLDHPEFEGPARLYACGPWVMLRKTAAAAARHAIPCDVLVEERMGCGVGACMSCAVRLKGADGEPVYVRACVEGPVFDAACVDWDAK